MNKRHTTWWLQGVGALWTSTFAPRLVRLDATATSIYDGSFIQMFTTTWREWYATDFNTPQTFLFTSRSVSKKHPSREISTRWIDFSCGATMRVTVNVSSCPRRLIFHTSLGSNLYLASCHFHPQLSKCAKMQNWTRDYKKIYYENSSLSSCKLSQKDKWSGVKLMTCAQ